MINEVWTVVCGGEVKRIASTMVRAYFLKLSECEEGEVYHSSVTPDGSILHLEGPIEVVDKRGRLHGDIVPSANLVHIGMCGAWITLIVLGITVHSIFSLLAIIPGLMTLVTYKILTDVRGESAERANAFSNELASLANSIEEKDDD